MGDENHNRQPAASMALALALIPWLAEADLAEKEKGIRHISVMSIVAAPEGIDIIQKNHPEVDIYVCAIDEKLDENGYIIPGVGDAGDRMFGTK